MAAGFCPTSESTSEGTPVESPHPTNPLSVSMRYVDALVVRLRTVHGARDARRVKGDVESDAFGVYNLQGIPPR